MDKNAALIYFNIISDSRQRNFVFLLHGSIHPHTALPPQYIKHWLFVWCSDAVLD